jgi:UDP-3-O-[3-hydroxymyristoyl] glucosamine N-acyltransferase
MKYIIIYDDLSIKFEVYLQLDLFLSANSNFFAGFCAVDENILFNNSGIYELGFYKNFINYMKNCIYVLAIKNIHIKRKVIDYLKLNKCNIHYLNNGSDVSQSAYIKDSNLGINASIGPDCLIKEQCQISVGSVISHNCKIGSYTYLGRNCFIAGAVTIGDKVIIGNGVKISKGISIGDGSIIEDASVVFRSCNANSIISGNPAKHIKFE